MKELREVRKMILQNNQLNSMEQEILWHIRVFEPEVAIRKLENTILYGVEEGNWQHLEEEKHIEYQLLKNRELIEEIGKELPEGFIFSFRNLVYMAFELSCVNVLKVLKEALENLA